MMPASLRSPLLLTLFVIPVFVGTAQFRDTSVFLFTVPQLDSLHKEDHIEVRSTTGEKVMWLAGATVAYSLFDYVGFNLARDHDTALPIYRVTQALVQIGLTWLLYDQVGLPTAVAFNLVWWTWGMDALFYGYTELFNVGGDWLGRGVFRKNILDNKCRWAAWTPVGMVRGMDSRKPIAGDTLIAQVLLGAGLALSITITL